MPQGTAPPSAGVLAAMLIVMTAGVLAYSNTFSAPFFFDDLGSILENPHIRRLWPLSQALTAPPQQAVAGRPVVSLSLAINYAIGELNVRGYHVFNLTVHLLCSLLLFGVVRRTLQRATFRGEFDRSAPWLGIAVAALWALHPLLSETVTYVTQRTELLMALFYLLTLYCVIRGWCSQRRRVWFAFAVVSCGLGMASKEVMVSAPLVVLLYDRAFVSGSFRVSLRRHAGLYVGLAGTWVILASLMATAPRSESVGFGLGVSALDYLRTQAEVLVWYLRLCFWPDPLVVSYEWPLAQTFSDCMPQSLIVVALLIGTLWALWRRPALGFVGACFFLILAPTSSIVPIVTEIAGERRMYLPLACVVVLFVFGVHRFLQSVGLHRTLRSPFPQLVLGVLVVTLIAALGRQTFRRNHDYRSVLSIWADTVAKRPQNYRAHSNLAGILIDAGRLEEAVIHCTHALQLRPDHARARANLALARKRQGRLDEAIRHYYEALGHRPRNAELRHNLAIALVAKGDLDEAIEHFIAALEIRPDRPLTHLNLAEALVARGRSAEAEVHYRETLRLRPTLVPAHYNFGNVLFGRGKIDEAIEHFLAVVRIEPGFADARSNLAVALARQGRTREAIAQYREALRLDPQHTDAYKNLGLALMTQGDTEGALEAYRQALKLGPHDADVLNNYGVVLLRTGDVDGAIVACRQALRVDPGHGDAIDNLSDALLSQGKIDEAVRETRAFVATNPQRSPVWNKLGSILLQQGKLDEAIQACQACLAANPSDPEILNTLGDALFHQGKLDQALRTYREVLRLEPDYLAARRNLGITLALQGKVAEAIPEYRAVLQADPRDAFTHNNLGAALIEQGDTIGAVAEYRQATHLKPDYSAARVNLADALVELGKIDEATGHYRALLRTNPANNEVRRKLDDALAKQRNPGTQ